MLKIMTQMRQINDPIDPDDQRDSKDPKDPKDPNEQKYMLILSFFKVTFYETLLSQQYHQFSHTVEII